MADKSSARIHWAVQGGQLWRKLLYRKIDETIALTGRHEGLGFSTKDAIISRILSLAKVTHALYLVDHPPLTLKGAWKKLVSSQRKRAVMACFRMVPLYALPRHRGINLFLNSYVTEWLDYEESPGVQLIEDVTAEAEVPGCGGVVVATPASEDQLAVSSSTGKFGSGGTDVKEMVTKTGSSNKLEDKDAERKHDSEGELIWL
ncbi:unnamed protein product [Protopolystoma xenopodis]|uniref:Uncharacterized protein n=1 Tax=Protopolystoma xenopodis TaxID=117903 RepID=A0A448X2E8_9PLAT|nr:unnamed protein product [Protopolystoma xenopodis]